MKIRFAPKRNTPEIEIRDLRGHVHGTWRAGEEQEIAADERVPFTSADGTPVLRPLADALLSCGPDFVDAASGKNPFFTCSSCNADALDESFTDRRTLAVKHVRVDHDDVESPKLCLACYLAAHPEYVAHHQRGGIDPETLRLAKERAPHASAALEPGTPIAPEPTPSPAPVYSTLPTATTDEEPA